MKRIFLNTNKVSLGDQVPVDRELWSHLKVLRVNDGEEFNFSTFNSQFGRVRYLKENLLEVISLEKPNLPLPITALCALTKNSEDLIEKLSELGVESLILFEAERSVVKNSRKLDRFKKIAELSASQSNRCFPLEVALSTDLGKALGDLPTGTRLVAALSSERTPLINEIKSAPITFAVGPEGDFTQYEYEILYQNNFKPVSLGDLVLRSETAALSMAATISNMLYSSKDG